MKQFHLRLEINRTLVSQGLISLCFCQTFFIAAPAQAFWFFHKHKNETQNSQANVYSNNYSSSLPSVSYVPAQNSYQQSRQGRRLVPAYLYNRLNNPPASVSHYNSNHSSSLPAISESAGGNKTNTSENMTNFKSSSFARALNTVPTNYTIKVGIGLNLGKAAISVLDGAQIIDNISGRVVANLPGQSQWTINKQENQIVLAPKYEYYDAIEKLALAHDSTSQPVETVAYYPGATTNITTDISEQNLSGIDRQILPSNINQIVLPIIGTSDNFNYTIKSVAQNGKSGLLALNERTYRGDFLLKGNSEKFNIINVVRLEDYLLAVVPSEMPSLWPDEALKAQAIAARSYAVANLSKHGSEGYDVKDNTEDQMYLGVKAETEATNKAVNFTDGLVIKYDGKPICAYFHSGGGGTTEAAENVWRKSLPYLKAVADFDQDSPMYSWTKNFTIIQAQNALPADKGLGKVLSISVSDKSPSGRAVKLMIIGSKNSCIISGEAARKYFNLPSTNFNVAPLENTYVFTGRGFGHGLGLSQWGARSLALHGYNAAQILCYYYNGVNIGY